MRGIEPNRAKPARPQVGRVSAVLGMLSALGKKRVVEEYPLFATTTIDLFLIGAILFVAGFTKGLAGFGQALVAVPLLAEIIGIRTTSPLMALCALVANVYLLRRHRHALRMGEIWRLSATSLLAIPFGVWGLRNLDERIVLGLLGVVLIGYSLYALFSPRLPRIENPNWAYPFGLVAGLLGGAYNTSGPPAVIYGTSRQWEPAEFKGNLQAFFLLNTFIVVASHALSHNFTPAVFQYFGIAVPFLAFGLWAGARMDRYLDPVFFRKIVLVILVVLGLTLVF